MKKIYSFILICSFHINSVELLSQYISIDGTSSDFYLNNQIFYPLTINYGVQIRKNSTNEYWVSPTHCYGNSNEFECNTKSECLIEISNQFQMIKDMGFNTIRLVGLSPDYNENYPSINSPNIFLSSTLLNSNFPISTSVLVKEVLNESNRLKLFSMINDVLNIAASKNLKVILLCGGPDGYNQRSIYSDYLEFLADYFKYNTSIFAYDIFNEPSYFSEMVNTENLSKQEICSIVSAWITKIKLKDVNHLVTIGFSNSNSVHDWDPELINIDFASFHPYGNENLLNNEIYWYSNHISKPWIIGETGLPADNMQTLYETQRHFAEITLKRCIDCGGKGYSWWQYQDVWWSINVNGVAEEDWFNNNLGLLTHDGITQTSLPGIYIQGTTKPVVSEFVNFSNYNPNYSCPMQSNYYNYSKARNKRVSGIILSSENINPISGAIINAYNSSDISIASSFSKSDGSFSIYSENASAITKLIIDYPKMESKTLYMNPLDYTPLVLSNLSFSNGQVQNYINNNNIQTSNLVINGNASSGGHVYLTAPVKVTLGYGTKVNYGGFLKVESNNVLQDILFLNKISPCSNALTGIDINGQNQLKETEKEPIGQRCSCEPNPVIDMVSFSCPNDETIIKFEIVNALGETVLANSNYENNQSINIESIESGIYFVFISRVSKIDKIKIVVN
jgi:hypothetical protein